MASAVSIRACRIHSHVWRDSKNLRPRGRHAANRRRASEVVRFLTIHKAQGLECPRRFCRGPGPSADILYGRSRLLVSTPKTRLFGCQAGRLSDGGLRTINDEKRPPIGGGEPHLYSSATRARESSVSLRSHAGARTPPPPGNMGYMFLDSGRTQPESRKRERTGRHTMRLTPMAALTGEGGDNEWKCIFASRTALLCRHMYRSHAGYLLSIGTLTEGGFVLICRHGPRANDGYK